MRSFVSHEKTNSTRDAGDRNRVESSLVYQGAWAYRSKTSTPIAFVGEYSSYHDGGYTAYLHRKKDNATEKMRDLRSHQWIDRRTR